MAAANVHCSKSPVSQWTARACSGWPFLQRSRGPCSLHLCCADGACHGDSSGPLHAHLHPSKTSTRTLQQKGPPSAPRTDLLPGGQIAHHPPGDSSLGSCPHLPAALKSNHSTCRKCHLGFHSSPSRAVLKAVRQVTRSPGQGPWADMMPSALATFLYPGSSFQRLPGSHCPSQPGSE